MDYPIVDPIFYWIKNIGTSGDPVWTTELHEVEYIKTCMLDRLADIRRQKEVSGVLAPGFGLIATDIESQVKICGAKTYMDLNPSAIVDWKAEGGWVSLDRDSINALASLIGGHVIHCFSVEKQKADAVLSCQTAQELIDMDLLSGW